MKQWLEKFDVYLSRFESGFIFVFLMLLILAGVLQILLRKLTDFAIPDLEVLMRWVVVWLTFFGASLATREKKHISVDVIGRLFQGKGKNILDIFIELFSLFIIVLLMLAARDFVADEMIYSGSIMNDIPVWSVEIVIPLGFFLIFIRLLLHLIMDTISVFQMESGK